MMLSPCSCATSSLITSWTIRCCFTRLTFSNALDTTVTFMNEPHPPAQRASERQRQLSGAEQRVGAGVGMVWRAPETSSTSTVPSCAADGAAVSARQAQQRWRWQIGGGSQAQAQRQQRQLRRRGGRHSAGHESNARVRTAKCAASLSWICWAALPGASQKPCARAATTSQGRPASGSRPGCAAGAALSTLQRSANISRRA